MPKVYVQRVVTERCEVDMPDGRTYFFEDVLKAIGKQSPEWATLATRVDFGPATTDL